MNDPFEDRLAALPRREIPPDWRHEVLPPVPARPQHSRALTWATLKPFFWPHPYAWAAVAALWIAILTLNISGPRGDDLYATAPPRQPTTETQIAAYLTHLRLQKLLLAQTQPVPPWQNPQNL